MFDRSKGMGALVLASLALLALPAAAVADATMFHYPEQLAPLKLDAAGSHGWSASAKAIKPAGGVLYPGETLSLELAVANATDAPLAAEPVIEVVPIDTRFERFAPERDDPMIGGQVLSTVLRSTVLRSTVPAGKAARFPAAALRVEPKKEATLRWQQEKGDEAPALGAYAVIVELPGKGRQAAATFVRVQPPSPAAGDGTNSPLLYHLHHAFDLDPQLEAVQRLGYRWVRTDGMPNWASVSRADVAAPFDWPKTDAWADAFRRHGLLILSNLYGSPRQTITEANWKAYNYVHDPKHDGRWGDFVEEAVARYCGADGKGPLRIIDFWNEPWEGGGWRPAARSSAPGGTASDPPGAGGISAWKSDAVRYRTLYKILYERAHKASRRILVGGTSSIMNTVDKFFSQPDGEAVWGRSLDVLTDHYVQPYACFGPRIALRLAIPSIETETWLGGSPEMLVATATHFIAAGQRKVNPNHPTQLLWQNGPAGPMAGPAAAAASFFLHFTAGLDFERIVLHEHLPWLYQWGGGDRVAFILAGDRTRLHPKAVTLYDQIRANGTITIDTMDGKLKAYDLFGNPYPAADGKYRLPCSTASVYLEAPGIPANMVTQTIAAGRIEGVKPVEFFVDDFIEPIERAKTLDFDVHNALNRQVVGTITVKAPSSITLQETKVSVSLFSGASKTIRVAILAAKAHPMNMYPITLLFEGAAGNAELSETLHVNTIAYGHPAIDGDLRDWKDAIPVLLHTGDIELDLAEAAWRPWEKRRDIAKGMAEAQFMWDERNLYIAVRERDKDWQPKPRLSTRNDDDYFGTGDLAHTYTKPIWDALPFTGHCFQVGLRFTSLRTKLPPYGAAPPRMIAEDDTDYEYALWGTPDGGAEIWRSNAPDLGFFNFLPRCMPAGYNGVPKGAQAVVKRSGTDTLYEAAIPLADIERLDPAPGKVIRMTFALPGTGIELGAGRSRCRANGLTLKPTWSPHPSNDIRWAFLKE